MTHEGKCESCGCELPADSPKGHCPDCLLKVGLGEAPHGEAAHQTLDSPAFGRSSGAESPSIAQINEQLPQLEVLELLGRGGMGAVYKARQKSLDRIVALKIINVDLVKVAGFAERFEREAKALARLNHPNIVGVHDFGEIDGHYYLVMEYVEGTDLRRLIASETMKPEQAIAIVPQMCAALQYAHDRGIVHRDIKPENILVDTEGQIKIADFGLAKLLGESEVDRGLTATNQVMGTPRYMAPEQMEGAATIDHRADIYSLGVVFYELLTGELPLGRFVVPSEKAAIDARLDEIVLRALEKELPQRFQQASEMKIEVERVADSKPSGKHSSKQPTNRKPSAIGSIETHVQIIAILNIVFSLLMMFAAIFVFMFMSNLSGSGDNGNGNDVLSFLGTSVGGFLFVLAIPGLLVGMGLWKLEPWSRIGAIVLAVFDLLNFPIGTVIAIYTIVIMTRSDCTELFRNAHNERMQNDELV